MFRGLLRFLSWLVGISDERDSDSETGDGSEIMHLNDERPHDPDHQPTSRGVKMTRALIPVAMCLASGAGLALADLPQTTVFAQASPVDPWMGMVETLCKALGPLVILAWYLYHKETVTGPRAEKAVADANAAAAAERQALTAAHTAQIQGLVTEIKAGREAMLEMVRKCGNHGA